MTKVGWYAVDKSTTLESNKSHPDLRQELTRDQPMAHQEVHQRWLRIDPVHSRAKRCHSVEDRSRLWKVSVHDRVRHLCCARHHAGFVFTFGSR